MSVSHVIEIVEECFFCLYSSCAVRFTICGWVVHECVVGGCVVCACVVRECVTRN